DGRLGGWIHVAAFDDIQRVVHGCRNGNVPYPDEHLDAAKLLPGAVEHERPPRSGASASRARVPRRSKSLELGLAESRRPWKLLAQKGLVEGRTQAGSPGIAPPPERGDSRASPRKPERAPQSDPAASGTRASESRPAAGDHGHIACREIAPSH